MWISACDDSLTEPHFELALLKKAKLNLKEYSLYPQSIDRENMRDQRKGNHSTTAGCMVFKKIIGQRTRGDKTYYKVQWEGQQLRTWELAENLNADKVAEFKLKTTAPAERSPPPVAPESKDKSLKGFQRGLEPKRILGMYEVGDTKTLMFKMLWKGSRTTDLVTVEEAKEKCPQLVIEFYEQRITWI